MTADDDAALEEAKRGVQEATRELSRLSLSGASSEALRDARDRLTRAEVALRLARRPRR
ncbi:MAG TPA: hypothetical protein VNX21_08980 [Candidatus Thermoplasmatota archaeon]|nr:hypothetical protein [Candidatus Thermoplasmatota archaeon]